MTARTGKPRKKRTIVEEEIPDGQSGLDEPLNEFDVSLESVDDTETLKSVLEQFGQTDNVLYRVYKQTPTGPPSFCYETPHFDEPFLQRERGAGIYTVRIFINGKCKKSIPVQVEAPTGTGSGASGPAFAPGDSHAQFLEKMLMALVSNMATHNQSSQGPTITDLTTALANLDGLRGKQESGLDMFKQGMDMAKTMMDVAGGGGGGDWKSELLKMGREAVPAITSIVQNRMTQPNGTPTVQPVQEQTMIDPEQMTDEQKKLLLKQTITYLKGQFISGLPPESALDFIIANSGNPQYQTVIRAVLAFSFEDIVKLDAELQSEPFNVCFRTVYDGLRSNFGSADSMDDDTGRDSGDDANVGNDGDVSKVRQ
jgi:hypothetical protein